MLEKDYIFLIMNCKKYRYKALKQKITWLKTLPDNFIYYHVIGDINLEEDYIFNEDEKILYIKCEDDYGHLPKKVILSIEIIQKTFKFKKIFKTDDDQMVTDSFYKYFFQFILNKIENKDYGGRKVVVRDHISDYHIVKHNEKKGKIFLKATMYSSGRFYFLSPDAVNNLLEKKEKIKKCYFEDHTIGLYLDKKYKDNSFWFLSDILFRDGF